MPKFVVEQSIHGLPCVQIHDDPALAERVAAAVREADMRSPAYITRVRAGAFLQGYDGTQGWCLVEFWLPEYTDFVSYLNTL